MSIAARLQGTSERGPKRQEAACWRMTGGSRHMAKTAVLAWDPASHFQSPNDRNAYHAPAVTLYAPSKR